MNRNEKKKSPFMYLENTSNIQNIKNKIVNLFSYLIFYIFIFQLSLTICKKPFFYPPFNSTSYCLYLQYTFKQCNLNNCYFLIMRSIFQQQCYLVVFSVSVLNSDLKQVPLELEFNTSPSMPIRHKTSYLYRCASIAPHY